MASQDRPDLALERARRVGQRLVERLRLEPPVDIASVIDAYADVQYEALPADCDAVVVGLGRARPVVIVQPDRPRRRLRFSLAHELGHILIPGHVGIEVCYTEPLSYAYSPEEREAHAFASEVLVPTAWLTEIAQESRSVDALFSEVQRADVSPAASCLAAIRVLPRGYVIALMRGSDVEMSLASPGTEANLPPQGQQLDDGVISLFCIDHGVVSLHARKVRWWAFGSETQLPDSREERTSSEILREIVSEVHADDAAAAAHALSSINGVAGHAKAGFGPVDNPEQMLARLRARLASRSKHALIFAHPLFDTYLSAKALELFDKQ